MLRDDGSSPPDDDAVALWSPPSTCAEAVAMPPLGPDDPVRVGPVSFETGPDAISGPEIRYFDKGKDGYVIKIFIVIEKFSSGQLTLTGKHVVSGAALTFDYPQEPMGTGYQREMVFPADRMDYLSLRPPAGVPVPPYWAAPGAWMAPELGAYEITVENDRGQRWSTNVLICRRLPGMGPLYPN
ncbi:MAG: hypothetical protein C0506_09370 [Anaerolinea sp.]|nr:hypothetical protein [Anaerolinea sp.]